MKAHLAEWQSVIVMNEKKRENFVHCLKKTGIFAMRNVEEQTLLAP